MGQVYSCIDIIFESWEGWWWQSVCSRCDYSIAIFAALKHQIKCFATQDIADIYLCTVTVNKCLITGFDVYLLSYFETNRL